MIKKITGTVVAGIASMMLTTTAFAGQAPVNTAPSATQTIGNAQTNSVRGLDIRKRRRYKENFYPGTDIEDVDIEDLI